MTLLDDCGQGVFLYFDNYISSYFYQFVNIIFFKLIIRKSKMAFWMVLKHFNTVGKYQS